MTPALWVNRREVPILIVATEEDFRTTDPKGELMIISGRPDGFLRRYPLRRSPRHTIRHVSVAARGPGGSRFVPIQEHTDLP